MLKKAKGPVEEKGRVEFEKCVQKTESESFVFKKQDQKKNQQRPDTEPVRCS